jgi:hypothetical protein
MNEFHRSHDRTVFFPSHRRDRFVFHGQYFAGMHDADAVIAEASFGKRGLDLGAASYKVKGVHSLIIVNCANRSLNDDAATMVATHDIHCNPHKDGQAGRSEPVVAVSYAPAVTEITWRPL